MAQQLSTSIISPLTGMKLSCVTEGFFQTAVSIMFTGHSDSLLLLLPLCPHGLVTSGQQGNRQPTHKMNIESKNFPDTIVEGNFSTLLVFYIQTENNQRNFWIKLHKKWTTTITYEICPMYHIYIYNICHSKLLIKKNLRILYLYLFWN